MVPCVEDNPGRRDAAPGGDVWVAAGVYPNDITVSTGANIYGGFAGNESSVSQRNWLASPTIVGAKETVDDIHVIPNAKPTTVDGFTIQVPSNCHGVYCDVGSVNSAITIANCTITGSGPDGIYCNGYSSKATLQITITDSVLSGAFVSGIECNSYSATVANSIVTQASACGVLCYGGGVTKLINNTLTGNGSGVTIIGGSSTCANNIVAFNQSGIVNGGSILTLDHDCVYGNNITNYQGVAPASKLADISSNPLFVGPGDYRLQTGSPCIDAGDAKDVVGTLDVYDDPRVLGPRVDIGAAEYVYSPPDLPIITDAEFNTMNNDQIAASWTPGDSNQIAAYQYAIGAPDSAGNITFDTGWTIGDGSTSIQKSLASLTSGPASLPSFPVHYLYVRAQESTNGQWSNAASAQIKIKTDLLGGWGDFEYAGDTSWQSYYTGTDYDFDTQSGWTSAVNSSGWRMGWDPATPSNSVAVGWSTLTGSTVHPRNNVTYSIVPGGINGSNCQFFCLQGLTSGSAWAMLQSTANISSVSSDAHPGDTVTFHVDSIRMSGYDSLPAGTTVKYTDRL